MNKLLSVILILLAATFANAAEIVTATVTITSAPANADTITINAGVRTWRTSVTIPATEVARVASAPGTAATNLFNQVVLYPFTGLRAAQTATNVVTFTTLPTTTVAVTLSAAYGTVTYTTQAIASLVAVRVPFTAIPDPAGTNRAYQANQLLAGIEANATNWFRMGANGTVGLPILSFVGDTDSGIYRTAADTWHMGANGTLALTIGSGYAQWNGSLYGTNGTLGLMVLNNPTTTNLVNYGNAISSPGSGTTSEEFGTGSTATGTRSLAVGNSADASTTDATAIGYDATASGTSSLAIGESAVASNAQTVSVGNDSDATGDSSSALGNASLASGANSTAIGTDSQATALRSTALGASTGATHTNAVAVGYNAQATFTGSVAIGASSATTLGNQIRLGTSSEYVSIPGNLNVEGNVNAAKIQALSLPRFDNTSLATGNNAAISISTNSFVRISSGPGAAFAICGIAGGTDGRVVTIYNAVAFNMTIANDSGVDATAANRIYTLTGSDYATTGIGSATLIYDSSASRWILTATRD